MFRTIPGLFNENTLRFTCTTTKRKCSRNSNVRYIDTCTFRKLTLVLLFACTFICEFVFLLYTHKHILPLLVKYIYPLPVFFFLVKGMQFLQQHKKLKYSKRFLSHSSRD